MSGIKAVCKDLVDRPKLLAWRCALDPVEDVLDPIDILKDLFILTAIGEVDPCAAICEDTGVWIGSGVGRTLRAMPIRNDLQKLCGVGLLRRDEQDTIDVHVFSRLDLVSE